jgi:ribosomal protein S18 acetylase RimI-like enzyme
VRERIVAYLRGVEEASVDEVAPTAHGAALLTPSLPLVWQLNALRAEDTGADARTLAAEAEAVLGGLAHRKVLVHDERQGAALGPGFAKLGWNVFRLLVMVRRRAPDRRPRAAGGELSREAGADALRAFRREQPFGWQDEAVRQLAEMDERIARATAAAHDFGSPPDDPACACRLYLDGGGLGQVDEVGTVAARRNRGYASAAVLAAADAAEAAGCDLVFLTTDAGDWPRHWYRRLGFEDVGAVFEFLKLPLGGDVPRAPGP